MNCPHLLQNISATAPLKSPDESFSAETGLNKHYSLQPVHRGAQRTPAAGNLQPDQGSSSHLPPLDTQLHSATHQPRTSPETSAGASQWLIYLLRISWTDVILSQCLKLSFMFSPGNRLHPACAELPGTEEAPGSDIPRAGSPKQCQAPTESILEAELAVSAPLRARGEKPAFLRV